MDSQAMAKAQSPDAVREKGDASLSDTVAAFVQPKVTRSQRHRARKAVCYTRAAVRDARSCTCDRPRPTMIDKATQIWSLESDEEPEVDRFLLPLETRKKLKESEEDNFFLPSETRRHLKDFAETVHSTRVTGDCPPGNNDMDTLDLTPWSLTPLRLRDNVDIQADVLYPAEYAWTSDSEDEGMQFVELSRQFEKKIRW